MDGDNQRPLRPYLFITFAVLLQGLSPVLTKLLLQGDAQLGVDLSAATVVASRYLLATLFLAPFGLHGAVRAVRRVRPRPADWAQLFFLGLLGSGLGAWLFTAALERSPAGVVNTLSKTAPIFVAVLAFLALRERISSLRFLVVGMMVGADILIGLGEYSAHPGAPELARARLVGDGLALLAGLSRALAEVLGKTVLRKFSPTTVSFARFLAGVVFAAPLMLGHGEWRAIYALNARGWLCLLLLAGPCTSLSMALYYRGLAGGQAHVAACLRLLGVVVTVPASWAIIGGGEQLHPLHIAGISILIFGAYLIVVRTARRPVEPVPPGGEGPAVGRAAGGVTEPEALPARALDVDQELVAGRPVRLSLKLKIAAVVVVLIVTIMCTSSYLSVLHTDQVIKREIRQTMAQLATAIAYTRDVGDPPSWVTQQQYVEKLVRSEFRGQSYAVRLVYIAVLDGRGHVGAFAANPGQLALADEFRANFRHGDKSAVRNFLSMHDNGVLGRDYDVQPATVYIGPAGAERGAVKLGFRRSLARRAADEVRDRNVLLTLLLVLAGIGLSVLAAGAITGPAERLARAMERVQRGELSVSVVPEGGDELEALGHAFNEMVEGLRAKELLDRAFSAYVSRQVAERILAGGNIVLEPARRKVTVLFSDIRGFVPLAERLGPTEVFEVLNEHFGLMINIVFRYEGMLDKYMGDSMMAVWGVFGEEQDDALRAVLAAVGMRRALVVLNRRRLAAGKAPIVTGIGINTGEVIAGSLGALGGELKRMEYAVIGDPVNLAQRIESHTVGTDILISESTYEEVREHVVARKMPPLSVKGKQGTIPVYQVVGLPGEPPFAALDEATGPPGAGPQGDNHGTSDE